MKKGPLHFLGRKNQSLFDTNIKIKDMDNVELALESSAIPESGTASVRARPTVKHHSSSSLDSFQGFNVPTPKVPVLPPFNGLKKNGSVSGDSLSNGSVISLPDLVEGEIFVPPPPSMAPPPPPEAFILPPPDFMGDLNSPVLTNIQPLSIPTPKQSPPSTWEEDFTILKPPPMAPPKPPSTCSSSSASSISLYIPLPANVPEQPKFAPPQPPSEKPHKIPPPKPVRMSSMSSLDSPPLTPAPPPPVQSPTPSSFNPQHTAKLYSVPKTSFLSVNEDRNVKPKQMLLLEDSVSVKSAPVLVQVNGKAPKVAVPPKPATKNKEELMEKLRITKAAPSPPPEPNRVTKTGMVSTPQIVKPPQTLQQSSPQLLKMNGTLVNSKHNEDKTDGSPRQSNKFSPLIDHKLRNLKNSETNGVRDGPAASPLALLMAAKKREKDRSTQSLPQKTSLKNDEPYSSIHPNDFKPNSFIVTPRSTSSTSLTAQELIQEKLKSANLVEENNPAKFPSKYSNSSNPGFVSIAASTTEANHVAHEQNTGQSPSMSESAQHDDTVGLGLPLLPPPPEFDDFDDLVGPPPSILPPDPPMKKPPTLAPSFVPQAQVPSPLIKPKPPVAPTPPPPTPAKPKPQIQVKPKPAPPQQLTATSPSQATLLSILQKKMLEMDRKMAPTKETEPNSDDWNSPLSDEETKVPVVPKVTTQSKNHLAPNKTATLDIRELEGKVSKKHQETPSPKAPTSNGLQSKHQYGMTFTVRPGTKQPITVASKAQS
ncbi:uncharacterized protein V6R79_023374 [Siganus canaliculatus]